MGNNEQVEKNNQQSGIDSRIKNLVQELEIGCITDNEFGHKFIYFCMKAELLSKEQIFNKAKELLNEEQIQLVDNQWR